MDDPELQVASGSVVALRVFDVAYEIDLSRVEALWSAHAGIASTRRKLTNAPAKAVSFDVPPVVVPLGSIRLELAGGSVTAEALARCYDFGVVTLALRVPVEDLAWTEFSALVNAVDHAVGPATDTAVWQRLLEQLRTPLAPAWIRPNHSDLQEDYLLGIVQQWSEASIGAETLLQRVDLVPLLSGERRPLSDGARRDLLRHRFSYYEDDLVVLTWDRAFIYEPRGDSDVAGVLEVANAQLLELRYYDELLDDELPRMYDLVEATRRQTDFLAPRRFAKLARKLYTLVAEVTELTEKVDNALKVTEDVYLARVYSAAIELLRVPNVSDAVNRKLAIIRDTYAALYDEAADTRGELLEIAIVVLIVAELLLALLRH